MKDLRIRKTSTGGFPYYSENVLFLRRDTGNSHQRRVSRRASVRIAKFEAAASIVALEVLSQELSSLMGADKYQKGLSFIFGPST